MRHEIGGYLEFEIFRGSLFHDDAIPLNCGRSGLRYLLAARRIEEILLPSFLCNSVSDACDAAGARIKEYRIASDLQPNWESIEASDGSYLYLVDYYGSLSEDSIDLAIELFEGRVILDETQNFFKKPYKNLDTIYSARKYFGVSDGGFLYTDSQLEYEIETDESYDRMGYVLGRFERPASEFFEEAQANNEAFARQPVKRMSVLTENILRALDYPSIIERRESNYSILDEALGSRNSLGPSMPKGPFAYPFLCDNGPKARGMLAEQSIYIPTLWPNVAFDNEKDALAKEMARNILPLPVDQRYGSEEMAYMVEKIIELEE